jgi:hypothetical protein
VDIKVHFRFHPFLLTILLSAALISCSSRQNNPIHLASFSENEVDVSINLAHLPSGEIVLNATFTPPDGYHLYSKDIPTKGVESLGRPTLLELTSNSRLSATGFLIESIKAQTPDFEPRELLDYPSGPVTLSLPVELPPGEEWIEDEIRVTYMACSAGQCKQPVTGKIIAIRIPGADAADIE